MLTDGSYKSKVANMMNSNISENAGFGVFSVACHNCGHVNTVSYKDSLPIKFECLNCGFVISVNMASNMAMSADRSIPKEAYIDD